MYKLGNTKILGLILPSFCRFALTVKLHPLHTVFILYLLLRYFLTYNSFCLKVTKGYSGYPVANLVTLIETNGGLQLK